MSEPTAVAPTVDTSKMTPLQLENWNKAIAAQQAVETPEAKAEREKTERAARIEFERRDQVSRTFAVKHADTFAPGTYNAEKMLSEMGTLPWTVENLEQCFERLTKQGQLLPPPYKEPLPEAPKPFDYRGLNLKKLKAMSRAEYKEKLDSPEYAPIIAQIVKDYNEGKSNE
jgi:hypothetical protein